MIKYLYDLWLLHQQYKQIYFEFNALMHKPDKTLTLSLVIPVYNEERYLKACLKAVAKQTVLPDEVIVVDNNSTDGTAEIARSFPFVKLLHEPVQGLIAARNRGFNEAKCEIIGRIDADAQVSPDWVERVKRDFMDATVVGVTGLAYTDTVAGSRFKTRLWSRMYFLMREADFKIYIFWGANMAISKSAWTAIAAFTCPDDALVHEDQDLSFLLATQGQRILRDNKLLITTNGDEYNELPKFVEYMQRASATKRRHSRAMRTAQASLHQLLPVERLWRLAVIIIPGAMFLLFGLGRYIIHGGGASVRSNPKSEDVS
ncbi:hypothetical protein BH10PAT3_BH10PAT3_2220 [soil metagenome]